MWCILYNREATHVYDATASVLADCNCVVRVIIQNSYRAQVRVQAPPLEIEKKKKSSEQILSYFTYILLLF